MSEKLWGVKRPDGTMIQGKLDKSKIWAVIHAEHLDDVLATVCLGLDAMKIRRARKAGYAIVRAAVVEVGEEER